MSLARKLAVNASLLSGGRMAVAAMGVVTIGISTRYLGLETFGAFAAATAFAATVSTLTDVGLWTIGAREIAKRPQDTQRIVGSVLTIGLMVSVVAAAAAIGLVFLLYPGQENELIRRGVLVLLLTVPLAAPYGAASAYFVSQQKAYMGMIGSLLASVVTLAGLVLTAALDWGFNGVLVAYVVASAVQGGVMIILVSGKVRLIPNLDLVLGRKLFMWALPLGGTLLVHSLYWRVDLILLSVLDSEVQVGLYGLGFKVLDAIVALPMFVAITLMPEFSRLAEQPARFDEIMQKAISAIQVATIAVFVLFVTYAPEITRIVGGTGFAGAASVLRILSGAVLFAYFGAVISQAFVARDRQGQLFWVALGALPVNIVLNLALIPPLGANGAAIAFAISEAVVLGAVVILYHRFAAVPRPHHLPRVLVAAAAMGAVALLKVVPGVDAAGPVPVFVVGSGLSIAAYVGCLYALRAMPPEIHANLVAPLLARLRRNEPR